MKNIKSLKLVTSPSIQGGLMSPSAAQDLPETSINYVGTWRLLIKAGMFALSTALFANASSAEPIKIGFAVANSGIMEPFDSGSTNSALLAIEQINSNGGVLGQEIEYEIIDTKSDRALGAKVGAELVDADVDMIVVSCDYDWGAPAALAAQNGGLISFFLCAEDAKAGIEGVGPYSFTAGVAAQVQGATMAEWSFHEKDARSAYVLLDDSIEYNKSTCAGFEDSWGKLEGATQAGSDTFKNSDPSIAAQITRIKALETTPDVIMICTYPPGGASALRQIRAAGLNGMIVSGMAMDGLYWSDAVPELSNFYMPVVGSIYGTDPNPEIEAFNKRYAAAYGSRPVSAYSYPGYTIIEMWAAAVNRAGTTETEAVVAELEKFENFPTLLGGRTFSDEYHIQRTVAYQIIGVENGTRSTVGNWQIEKPIERDLLFRIK